MFSLCKQHWEDILICPVKFVEKNECDVCTHTEKEKDFHIIKLRLINKKVSINNE